MASQTILDQGTCFRRQLDTGQLVPCVRECRNFISKMSGMVCLRLLAHWVHRHKSHSCIGITQMNETHCCSKSMKGKNVNMSYKSIGYWKMQDTSCVLVSMLCKENMKKKTKFRTVAITYSCIHFSGGFPLQPTGTACLISWFKLELLANICSLLIDRLKYCC